MTGAGGAGWLRGWAATRAGLLLVGLLASRLLVSGLTLQKGNLVYHPQGPAVLDVWARWDSEWYLLIAEHGYHSEEYFLGRPVAYEAAATTGFFPLYPLLIRAGAACGLSFLAAGVLISNLALLAALWFLHELVRRDLGDPVAQASLWVLLAFPTSFFLSAVYAESLLLAGVLGSLWAARAGRPWLAGLLGAVATLARPTGILVLLPLADEAMNSPPPAKGGRFSSGVSLLLPPAALGGFMLFCRASFGSYAPFLERQERWRGALGGPWRAFARYLEAPHLHDAHHSTIDLICALLLVGSIPWLFRHLPRSYALYATAAILLPLGSTLWSFSRFAATIFPCHVLLGRLISRRPAWGDLYTGLALPLSGLFMALYAGWWWVG
ncbi:MAG TPA: mannosyltransferase family protein [Candidatus Polarisedimenticolia bacterium]